jgi:hypothetical protein
VLNDLVKGGKMSFKSMTILALVIFLVSLFAVPAFAGNTYVRPVRGCVCAVTRAQQGTTYVPSQTNNKYVSIDGQRVRVKCITNPIQGALHAFASMFESEEYKAFSVVCNCSSRHYCPGNCP